MYQKKYLKIFINHTNWRFVVEPQMTLLPSDKTIALYILFWSKIIIKLQMEADTNWVKPVIWSAEYVIAENPRWEPVVFLSCRGIWFYMPKPLSEPPKSVNFEKLERKIKRSSWGVSV